MAKNIQLIDTHNTYDEVPYESYPFYQSHPYHLKTIGTLFGMTPPAVETAKVLELGGASGGNLIPHAINYPNAHFVCVDLSKVQIDEANNHKEKLGLKNIEFHHCSITDIDESFGKFDYILCHGVISWVPEAVRDKIFEICEKNLNENGIAYISYNTLPGWNMIRTIRDMMLYHSSMFTDIKEKVNQSRLLLQFVSDSLEGSKSPYAEVLKHESLMLSKHSDHYLRHDHMEFHNHPYYVADFMKEANKYYLQYLADSALSTMYLGNMPALVVEKLQAVNDIVRTEQYMDFITNRRFRSTLLCHKSVKLNRSLNNEDVMKFNLSFNLVPEKPLAEVDINDAMESLKFFYNGNKDSSLSTSSPCMKAILYTFNENFNNPISFDKITVSANRKLGGNKLVEVKNELLNNAMRLVLQGYINITLQETRSEPKLDKPKVPKLVNYQVSDTNNLWVTNLRHEIVGINLFEKYAMQYMNGKNDRNKIIEAVMAHVSKGDLSLNKDNVKLEDETEIRQELGNILEVTLKNAAINALLL